MVIQFESNHLTILLQVPFAGHLWSHISDNFRKGFAASHGTHADANHLFDERRSHEIETALVARRHDLVQDLGIPKGKTLIVPVVDGLLEESRVRGSLRGPRKGPFVCSLQQLGDLGLPPFLISMKLVQISFHRRVGRLI